MMIGQWGEGARESSFIFRVQIRARSLTCVQEREWLHVSERGEDTSMYSNFLLLYTHRIALIPESKRHAAKTRLSGAKCYPPHAPDSVPFVAPLRHENNVAESHPNFPYQLSK
jgi:hypothetical protein